MTANHMAGDGPGRLIIILSSINQDMTLLVNSFPAPGETTLSTAMTRSLGGKGANTAVAAAHAGGKVRMLGAVGCDDGGVLEELRRHDVDASQVSRLEDAETGRALIVVDAKGENCIVVHLGANARVGAGALDRLRHEGGNDAEGDLSDALLVLHLEIPHEAVQDAACRAHDAGATVVLNPSPVPRDESPLRRVSAVLWGAIDVLVVNEGELVALSTPASTLDPSTPAEPSFDTAQIIDRVRKLRNIFSSLRAHIVVTLGSRGAALFTRNEENPVYVDAVPVDRVVDTTGAGDCLTGYLCAGIARGWGMARALRVAVAAASLCVGRSGAADAIPGYNEVQLFMDNQTK